MVGLQSIGARPSSNEHGSLGAQKLAPCQSLNGPLVTLSSTSRAPCHWAADGTQSGSPPLCLHLEGTSTASDTVQCACNAAVRVLHQVPSQAAAVPQQRLNFFPEPQGQAEFLEGAAP